MLEVQEDVCVMNAEAEIQAESTTDPEARAAREAREVATRAASTSSGIQYAKAPSMWWFIVPMAALLAYGFLSR